MRWTWKLWNGDDNCPRCQTVGGKQRYSTGERTTGRAEKKKLKLCHVTSDRTKICSSRRRTCGHSWHVPHYSTLPSHHPSFRGKDLPTVMLSISLCRKSSTPLVYPWSWASRVGKMTLVMPSSLKFQAQGAVYRASFHHPFHSRRSEHQRPPKPRNTALNDSMSYSDNPLCIVSLSISIVSIVLLLSLLMYLKASSFACNHHHCLSRLISKSILHGI